MPVCERVGIRGCTWRFYPPITSAGSAATPGPRRKDRDSKQHTQTVDDQTPMSSGQVLFRDAFIHGPEHLLGMWFQSWVWLIQNLCSQCHHRLSPRKTKSSTWRQKLHFLGKNCLFDQGGGLGKRQTAMDRDMYYRANRISWWIIFLIYNILDFDIRLS